MRLLLAVLVSLLLPAHAGAAVTLGYEFLPGDCNRYGCLNGGDRLEVVGDDAPQAVTIGTEPGALLVITDDGAVSFRAHPAVAKTCAEIAPGRWRCDFSSEARVRLGGGDDRLTSRTVGVLAEGGPGADLLTGGDAHDVLDGGEGQDVLSGGPRDDELRSDSAHPDAVDGGAGIDTLVLLGDHADRVDLGAGTYGAGGALSGVESIAGGAGDDVLSGTAGADRLWGGDGDDRLDGRGGGDALHGGDGRDRLVGGAGGDRLDPGSTPVEETQGLEDEPTGEIARWDLDGQVDRLSCGTGTDRVVRPGTEDVVPRGCEHVTVYVLDAPLTVTGLHGRARGGRLHLRVLCADTFDLRLARGRREVAREPDGRCGRRTLRLRVPRRLPRLLDVRLTDGTVRVPPGRFRVRR